MNRLLRYALLTLAVVSAAGCKAWTPLEPHDRSLLKSIELASDAVQLEVISVRFPYGQDEINGAMWNEIDEQQIAEDVRRRLGENGLRVGLVGRELPGPLARMIASAEKRPRNVGEAAAQFERASPVSREQMQLHSGWHGEIMTSAVYAQMPLLMQEEGKLCGRTYPAAQGMLETRAEGEGDHRLRLQITPQIEYGEMRQQWFTEDGRMMPQQGKPKRVFDRLAFDATLAEGQMLVISCWKDLGGTLGHFLFTETRDDQLQQKVLVVRLADSRYDDLFSPSSAAPEGSEQLAAQTKGIESEDAKTASK